MLVVETTIILKSNYEATQLVKKGCKWDNNAQPVFYSGGNIPVYVAFNPNASSGSHNFTKNSNEQNSLLKSGWEYGAVAWTSETWITPKPQPSWKPGVSRFYTIPGIAHTVFGDNIMEEADVNKLGPVTLKVDADLDLTGSGRGYHGKLMIGDMGGDNVSFGIQYDAKSGLDDGLVKGCIYQKMLQTEEYMKEGMLCMSLMVLHQLVKQYISA